MGNRELVTKEKQGAIAVFKGLPSFVRGLIVLLILMIVFIVALFAIWLSGRAAAETQYENEKAEYEITIADMQDEIDKLNEELENRPYVYEPANTEIGISVIETKFAEIGELATSEYLYTDAGRFSESNKVFDITVPFSEKYFVAKWNGCIKAGILMKDVTFAVDNESEQRKITINIPKAQILSHEVDHDSVETLDQHNGLFNPIKVDDVRNFDKTTVSAMEARALEAGLLDKATDSAAKILQGLVYDIPDVLQGEYVVEVIVK